MNINLLYQYWKLKRQEKYSKKALSQLQWIRFKHILEYSYLNSPFYKEKFNQAGIKPDDIKTKSDLIKIPITTKEEVILAKEDIFAKGYNKDNCFSSITSGSTGQPFTSYFDSNSWNILKFASKLRARQACGLKITDRIINIDYVPVEEIKEKNLKEGRKLSNVFLSFIILDNNFDHKNHTYPIKKYFNSLALNFDSVIKKKTYN